MEMITILKEDAPLQFPDPNSALHDGLLALGGDLTVERMLLAYRSGIFPWFSDEDPILWWSPNPRVVIFPEQIHVNRSLRKTMRQHPYRLCFDTAFDQVVSACSEPRDDQPGTWITSSMQQAYRDLFQAGHAHSIEVWDGNELVGGLFGIAIGSAFFGESMFSRKSDASKIALVALARQLHYWQFHFIDCQMATPHLERMGAKKILRNDYLARLAKAIIATPQMQNWKLDTDSYSD